MLVYQKVYTLENETAKQPKVMEVWVQMIFRIANGMIFRFYVGQFSREYLFNNLTSLEMGDF